jgi:hypothetical protein
MRLGGANAELGEVRAVIEKQGVVDVESQPTTRIAERLSDVCHLANVIRVVQREKAELVGGGGRGACVRCFRAMDTYRPRRR